MTAKTTAKAPAKKPAAKQPAAKKAPAKRAPAKRPAKRPAAKREPTAKQWPTELTTVALADVQQHPANPRRGDTGKIRESMQANGFLSPIVVQKSTGYVIAGNHRVRVALELGMDVAPALVVDMPDDMATRFLLADNRAADEATYDQQRLAEVLTTLTGDAEDGAALVGTAYSQTEVDIIKHRAAWQREEDAPSGDGKSAEDGEIHEREGAPERKQVLERLARRSIVMSVPVVRHAAFAQALTDARERHSAPTNEELFSHYLRSDGLLPDDFVMFDTDAKPKAKGKKKKAKKGKR